MKDNQTDWKAHQSILTEAHRTNRNQKSVKLRRIELASSKSTEKLDRFFIEVDNFVMQYTPEENENFNSKDMCRNQ
ncbi:gcvP [Acrasis kona]|uniref:GcvP n=1 Tax=Acrasis kona TaxID=1008807 RepID=A0AAW2Z3N5_9EUKA